MMTIESPGAFWKDYELIDSGNFEKLERFGPFIMARPEPKALWEKSLSEGEWNKLIHTRFKTGAGFGKAGKEDSGTWERRKKMDDQWYIRYKGAQEGLDFSLRLGLTSFKHVGVFPEQSANWEYIYSLFTVFRHCVQLAICNALSLRSACYSQCFVIASVAWQSIL